MIDSVFAGLIITDAIQTIKLLLEHYNPYLSGWMGLKVGIPMNLKQAHVRYIIYGDEAAYVTDLAEVISHQMSSFLAWTLSCPLDLYGILRVADRSDIVHPPR